MNIFVLDYSPSQSAQYMCDKHIPKMCVESAQLMACALISNGCPTHEMPVTKKGERYKGGYKHHPCAVWAGASHANFIWLATHAVELCREFYRRYEKTHACYEPIMVMANNGFFIEGNQITPFVQAMPDEFKSSDPVVAYRKYYSIAKRSFASWDRCTHGKPSWWMDEVIPEHESNTN